MDKPLDLKQFLKDNFRFFTLIIGWLLTLFFTEIEHKTIYYERLTLLLFYISFGSLFYLEIKLKDNEIESLDIKNALTIANVFYIVFAIFIITLYSNNYRIGYDIIEKIKNEHLNIWYLKGSSEIIYFGLLLLLTSITILSNIIIDIKSNYLPYIIFVLTSWVYHEEQDYYSKVHPFFQGFTFLFLFFFFAHLSYKRSTQLIRLKYKNDESTNLKMYSRIWALGIWLILVGLLILMMDTDSNIGLAFLYVAFVIYVLIILVAIESNFIFITSTVIIYFIYAFSGYYILKNVQFQENELRILTYCCFVLGIIFSVISQIGITTLKLKKADTN